MPLATLVGKDACSESSPTIVFASWIATVASDGPGLAEAGEIITNGAIAFEGGRIKAVGQAEDVRAAYASREAVTEIVLPEHHVLIPGLINTHTHLSMSYLRGYADDLCLASWLNDFIWPTEKTIMSEDYVYQGTLIACTEALMSGTTMVNDSYFLPEAGIRATCKAGIRAVHGAVVLDFGDGKADAQLQQAIQFIKKVHTQSLEEAPENNLVRVSYGPHAPYTVSSDLYSRGAAHIATINKETPETPVILHTHLHETEAECAQFEKQHGNSAVRMLDEAGALNQHLVAAHCVHLTPEQVQLFAERKANIAHCPKSNAKLASGFAPVWSMMKAGVNVALGTDGGCSNNSVDMMSEMQFAALIGKAVSKDAAALDAYSVLRMATRNGSRALGRLHDLGSLEVGKLADIVAVDLAGDGKVGLPIFDPISHLVYTTHPKVTNVWIGGRRVVHDRRITTLQVSDTEQEALTEKLQKFRHQLFVAAAEKENVIPATTEA